MFIPKNTKYKKLKKKFFKKNLIKYKSNSLRFGFVGLKTLETVKLSSIHLEMCRQLINRKMLKKGILWIKVFPYIPVTKKPNENRMGKGKGIVNHWISFIKAGTLLFELQGISYSHALSIFSYLQKKLPVKTKIVYFS